MILHSKYTTSTKNKLFNKILIANRGEIACRVIRTAKALGIKVTALYSEQDRFSMHTQLADEAVLIGPSPASESYLCQDKVISIAKERGIDAIHPGYGFLSENAIFADRCEKEGIVFIGPPSSAIRDMGSKSASKIIMINAGVPVVPGYHGEDQSDERLHIEAEKIGYPVLIKAVLGGGGKGMRLVERKEDLQDGIDSARREAKKSFDDDRLLLEKFIVKPRHVEVQVFCDKYGNAVYLFERDCSVQRRHQKIIEEAPAPNISEELRERLGQAAVNAAKAVGYVGAGTVEFILDENHQFYFMEMNTRLQVEHPITEMITKQDLVEWQLRVASGQELLLKQEDLKIHGHAFEARIYAENPRNSFLPSPGKIVELSVPETDESIRIDTGVRKGDVVSLFYDPMIAKLIVHGKDRETALKKLNKALKEYHVGGLHTNINFLISLSSHPEFVNANIDTGFIERHKNDLLPEEEEKVHDQFFIFATVKAILDEQKTYKANNTNKNDPFSIMDGKCFNTSHPREFIWEDSVTLQRVHVKAEFINNQIRLVFDNSNVYEVHKILDDKFDVVNLWVRRISGDKHEEMKIKSYVTQSDPSTFFVDKYQLNRIKVGGYKLDEAELTGGLLSPMPGKVVRVMVKENQKVKKGEPLLILEAMKMEHTIKSPIDGIVKKLKYNVGDLVEEKEELIELSEEE